MQNQYYWGLTDEEEYIAHHGILGQKWGIRRYQNPDGSLTPEGKSRVQNHDSKTIYSIAKNRASNMYKNMSESDIEKRRKAFKDNEEAHNRFINASDTTSKKELQKLKSDVNKTSEAVNKIRQSDIKKIFKDLDLDDYWLKRDVESAFSDISDKYIYSPVRRSMKSDDLKSKAKTTLKVVGDLVSGVLEAGGWDALLRELI